MASVDVVGKGGTTIKLTLILPIDTKLLINILSDFSSQLIDLCFVLTARSLELIFKGLELFGL